MAQDIELAELATRTTTTITEDKVQPREGDTVAVGDAVDVGDDRALSLELVAIVDAAYAYAIVEAWVETSEDGVAWREIARFKRASVDGAASHRERISCTTDRYVRAAWRVAKGYLPDKGGVRFGISGRAAGSDT